MIKLNGQPVTFETYPNGESRLIEPHFFAVEDLNGVTLTYESDADLIQLAILKDFLDDEGFDSGLLITSMPYARMDRPNGHAFSLRTVCGLINNMGFENVVVVDPHSDVTPALLDPCTEVSVMDALVEQACESEGFDQFTYFVFPDAGAQKKYEKYVREYAHADFFIGLKHRNFETGDIERIQVLCSDPEMESVKPLSGGQSSAIIIDDMSSYGGTFVGVAQQLREVFGFERVALVVAHAEPSIHEGKLMENVDHVYTTDSMVDHQDSNHVTRYTVLDLLEGDADND